MDHRPLQQAAIFLLSSLSIAPSPALADGTLFRKIQIWDLDRVSEGNRNGSTRSNHQEGEDTLAYPVGGGRFLTWMVDVCSNNGSSLEPLGIVYSITGKNSGNIYCDGRAASGNEQVVTGSFESIVVIGADGVFDLTGTFSSRRTNESHPTYWDAKLVKQRVRIKFLEGECQVLFFEQQISDKSVGYDGVPDNYTSTLRNTALTKCTYAY